MAEITRLHLPEHGRQLLVDLLTSEHDVRVYCADGVVNCCGLVLACLSPVLRGALEDVEEPALLLPDVAAGQFEYFLKSLATTGNLDDHKELIHLLGITLTGWVSRVSRGVKLEEDEGGSELLKTAQNLPLLSPLTWRRTTLELAGGDVINGSGDVISNVPSSTTEFSRPRTLAKFVKVLETDTDGYNECFETDCDLKSKCDMYIGQTEFGYVCKLATCTYSNPKKILLKYHVLAHLGVNTFKKPKVEESGYVEFLKKTFKKKSQDEIVNKISQMDEDELASTIPPETRSPTVLDQDNEDLGLPEDPLHLDKVEDGLQDILTDEDEPSVVNTVKKRRRKVKSKGKVSPANSKKKFKMDEMSDETKQKCDQFIVFVQNTREYKCVYTDCNYSHRSKTWLKYHVMKHLDISEYLCEECGEAFAMQKLLKKHVITIHGSDELRAAIERWIIEDIANPTWYRCLHPQCGFAAATKKGAGLHALSEHMEKSFICDLCGEGFVTERSLQNHSNYHHNKGRNSNKLYPCSFCQKSFRTASYLDAHENEHKGVRPYQCDTCGKSFASNGMLRSHKFAHAPKIFKCDCCDQAFPRKNTLMVHLRAVHMHEKPYECDICGQKFPRSSSMTRHRRIHTGLPRYNCHYCDKTTTQRGDLNRHMAKVHGWPSRDYRQQQQTVVHTQILNI